MKRLSSKIIFLILIVLTLFCNHVIAFASINAVPSTAKVFINGAVRSFEAYSIKGSNYFKPDDLAKALIDDSKDFDVLWDGAQNAFRISKNKQYSAVNKEIISGDGTIKTAEEISAKVIVDNEEMQFVAYTIGSNTYFKLQDIMRIADVQVAWNDKKGMIMLDTSRAYADAPKPLTGFVICVDPGHGNSGSKEKEAIAPNSNVLKAAFVSGTRGSVYSEAEINLSVGIMLKEKLVAQGATVIMTREGTDATLSNVGRAKLANDANADLAIRIHCDGSTSSKAAGMSMLVPGKQYVSENLVNDSYKIGEVILNKLIEKTGAASRGIVTRNDLTGFNWSTVPSVLIEMGFMTNPQEDALLGSGEYQGKITDGITEAIVDLYKTEINKVVVTELPPTVVPTVEVALTEVPPTEVPPTEVPPTEMPITEVPPTEIPPTEVPPTEVPPTEVPPTEVPPTEVPPTEIPPTEVPPTEVLPTEVPPTEVPPTEVLPTEAERILNDRIRVYFEQTWGISQEEAKWKVKMDLDKPEFTEANLLSKEELQSISVVVNKRNRVPDDYVPDDLVNITERVALRSEAKTAFDLMVSDAKIEGYRIMPISGFRTVDYQRNLYNRYLKRDSFASVETYSARAGFSEHHTGLAIDVGGASNNMSSFASSREYPWVVENGHKYGFIIRYRTKESNITGYMNEPWHLRYVGIEVARVMDIEGIKTLEEYVGKYVR